MNHKLNWYQTWDNNDNSIWEACGPYSDECGGCLAYWRLVHKLIKNQPVWVAEHDADLEGMEDGDGQWKNLESAKSDILKLHNELLESEYATSNSNL